MKIHGETKEFINELRKHYIDKIDTDEKTVGTPEYWKTVGVVELIRQYDNYIDIQKKKQKII